MKKLECMKKLTVVAALFCAATVWSQTDYTWMGGGGTSDWLTPANWGGGGYPGQNANDTATINSNAEVELTALGGALTIAGITMGGSADASQRVWMNANWGAGTLTVTGPAVFNAASGTTVEFGRGELNLNGGFTVFPGDGHDRTFIITDWIWAGVPWNLTLHDNNNSAAYYNNRYAFRGLAGTGHGILTVGPANPSGVSTNYLECGVARLGADTLTLRSAGTTLDYDSTGGGTIGYLRMKNDFTCQASASGVPTVRIAMNDNGFSQVWDNEYPAPITVFGQLFGNGVYPHLIVDASAFDGDNYVPLVALRNAAAGTELVDRWADITLSPNIVRLLTRDQTHTLHPNGNGNYRTLYALVKGTTPTFSWVTVSFDWQDDAITPTVVTEEYVAGDPFYALPVADVPGRIFVEWNTQADGQGTTLTTASFAPGSATTYYAIYAPQVEIYFDWQDDETPQTVTSEYYAIGYAFGEFSALPTPTRAGWNFASWNTAPDGSGTTITESSLAPGATETYYALWFPAVAYWDKGTPVTTDDSDWLIGANWDMGVAPGAPTETYINKNGAVVNVTNDVTVARLWIVPPSLGDPITLNIANGKTLTINETGETRLVEGNNMTPVTLNVEGTLWITGGNTRFGFGSPSDVTITGGGLIALGYQCWFGQGTYWSGNNLNSRLIVTGGTTIQHGWNTFYGHCILTNCVLTGNRNVYFIDKPDAESTLHNVTFKDNGNRIYGREGGVNASVIFKGGSEIENKGSVAYAHGEGATVLLSDGSTMVDSGTRTDGLGGINFFRNYNFNQPVNGNRRFIVDDATYTATGTFSDIGGDDDSFTNNWIIVRNGGTFEFANAMSFGTTVDVEEPNGIEIDNSTFTGGSLNLRNNSVLDVKGGAAAIALDALTCSDTTLDNAPTLKVTVPVDGFASAPITVGELDAGMNLAVDALAFTAAGGRGTVPILAVAGEVADLDATTFWRSMTLESRLEIVPRLTPITIGGDAYTLLSVNIRNRATMILVR